jgi:NTE family protein
MRNELKEISRPSDEFAMPRYDEIALVLQGGGALGSYQAGVVESLAEARIEPTWIAGVSIGALNTAIIAGNAPEDRVKALHDFWNAICRPRDWVANAGALMLPYAGLNELVRKWTSNWAAGRALAEGQPGFFVPRFPLPLAGLDRLDPARVSYYDTAALKATLLQYADFDRINDGPIRVSVGAVNVRTGNLVYFDNTRIRLVPEHFMASGALPPGFPAIEIDGEYYWDGGLVSNTPLTEILAEAEHKNSLNFQVDLWSARGKTPVDFLDISERTKDIQYSSRTRAITDLLADRQKHARLLKEVLKHVPENVAKTDPIFRIAKAAADGSSINVVHLIYKNKSYEGSSKDYEFSVDTMREHWQTGLDDCRNSLAHRDWFDIPSREHGFVTHDVHRVEAHLRTKGEHALGRALRA